MPNLSKKKSFAENRETIDALVALQMLEEQDHRQEQEFFRIVGEMQQLGCNAWDLEHNLPDLLKTKREQALYDALMAVAGTPRQAAGFPLPVRERRKVEYEFRERC